MKTDRNKRLQWWKPGANVASAWPQKKAKKPEETKKPELKKKPKADTRKGQPQ